MTNLYELDVRLASHRAFVTQIERAHQLGYGAATVHVNANRFELRPVVQRFLAALRSGAPVLG